jgi:hypothetical protein
MSILHPQALFQPRAPLVDVQGIPTSGYGRGFLQALYTRTGSGTGIVPIVSDPLTATGVSIADALQLTADWNDIEDGTVNTGVAIPTAVSVVPNPASIIASSTSGLQPGNDIWVFNGTPTLKFVYPPDAQTQIDALGPGIGYQLGAGKLRCFQCWRATQFHSYGN